MSNKLRLAIVLPSVQLLLALILLRVASHPTLPRGWDTPYTSATILFCAGINAPAFPLISLGLLLPKEWQMSTLLGFDAEQAFFLIGVALVWWWAGQTLDTWRARKASAERRTTPAGVFLKVLQLAWGLLLLTIAVGMVFLEARMRLGNSIVAYAVCCLLFFAWAAVLIVGSVFTFMIRSTLSAVR
jgi:hypothetical protein